MKSVDIGAYYHTATLGLVRTVARAYDSESGDAMIMYAPIEKNGIIKDMFLMEERKFLNTINFL